MLKPFITYEGTTDEWRAYGYAMESVYSPQGKYIGRAYRFDEKRRPKVGEPVKCWQGEVRRIVWVRAHHRRWRIRTDDGVLRTVAEFPTSFIWSQVG